MVICLNDVGPRPPTAFRRVIRLLDWSLRVVCGSAAGAKHRLLNSPQLPLRVGCLLPGTPNSRCEYRQGFDQDEDASNMRWLGAPALGLAQTPARGCRGGAAKL